MPAIYDPGNTFVQNAYGYWSPSSTGWGQPRTDFVTINGMFINRSELPSNWEPGMRLTRGGGPDGNIWNAVPYDPASAGFVYTWTDHSNGQTYDLNGNVLPPDWNGGSTPAQPNWEEPGSVTPPTQPPGGLLPPGTGTPPTTQPPPTGSGIPGHENLQPHVPVPRPGWQLPPNYVPPTGGSPRDELIRLQGLGPGAGLPPNVTGPIRGADYGAPSGPGRQVPNTINPPSQTTYSYDPRFGTWQPGTMPDAPNPYYHPPTMTQPPPGQNMPPVGGGPGPVGGGAGPVGGGAPLTSPAGLLPPMGPNGQPLTAAQMAALGLLPP